MSSLLDRERVKYEQMWGLDSYAAHSPGAMFVPIFLDMAQTTMRGSVLDAGCGSGKGAIALDSAGFAVRCCDVTDAGLIEAARRFAFTPACLWDDLIPDVGFSDWVYCCDVLEHVPTPLTMLVVTRLLSVARRGVFLSISTVADVNGVWIGEPLHQTIQPFVSWRDHLNTVARVKEARDFLNAACFLVVAK